MSPYRDPAVTVSDAGKVQSCPVPAVTGRDGQRGWSSQRAEGGTEPLEPLGSAALASLSSPSPLFPSVLCGCVSCASAGLCVFRTSEG